MKRQGSVTVEAALVMPLALGAIFFVITFSLWLRDAGVTGALTLESVQRTRREPAAEAAAWLNRELEGLIWAVPGEADVEGQGKAFLATAKREQRILGTWGTEAFRYTARRQEIDPIRLLRMARLLAEMR